MKGVRRLAPTQPATELFTTPHGAVLEHLSTGVGPPVTVFAHGWGQDIGQTRPLGSGVPGRRVFFQFRGHGRATAPDGRWTFLDLAEDLRAIADATGARRAVGVSLGAGALCRLLAGRPDRFDRVVLLLPAVLDRPQPEQQRRRLAAFLEHVSSGRVEAVEAELAAQLPEDVRDTAAARDFITRRARQLVRERLAPQLANLLDTPPVRDLADLAAVTARTLVLGARGDELHRVEVAERLAAALPRAELHVYDRPAVLWTARADLRERISTFLSD